MDETTLIGLLHAEQQCEVTTGVLAVLHAPCIAKFTFAKQHLQSVHHTPCKGQSNRTAAWASSFGLFVSVDALEVIIGSFIVVPDRKVRIGIRSVHNLEHGFPIADEVFHRAIDWWVL